MRGVDEVDQVLLCAEVWVNLEVVVDVIAVISIGIVLKDRRQPDGRASQAGDVVEIVFDAPESPAVEQLTRGNTRGPPCLWSGVPNLVIMKAIDQEEVDELLAPLALGIEVDLARFRAQIEVSNGRRSRHAICYTRDGFDFALSVSRTAARSQKLSRSPSCHL